mmetsp:Transcript_11836/g.17720  ORF Transcript_11836/g.17720 Transcript_11836/m.17720 type:complete len:446 (+) Transcript_11836:67-1404(+)
MNVPPGFGSSPPPGLAPIVSKTSPDVLLPLPPNAIDKHDEEETVVTPPEAPVSEQAFSRPEERQSKVQQRHEHVASRTYEHAQLPRFPASTCMSGRDIALVVRSQMKVLETADVYSSDYYAHRFVALKKQREETSLVRPVWEDQKADIKNREAHLLKDQRLITHKWEEGHRVLGHVQKSDITRPRAILGVDAAEVGLRRIAPFSSSLWAARRAVDAGLIALLALEETRHYGASMAGNIDPTKMNQLMLRAKACLIAVLAAVAANTEVNPAPTDIEPKALAFACGISNEKIGFDIKTIPDNQHPFKVSTLEALLAMTKGVKLLTRVVSALPYTCASSQLVQTTLIAFRNRPPEDKEFTHYDTRLAAVLRDHILPRIALPALIDLAITYAENMLDFSPSSEHHSALKIMSEALLTTGDTTAASDTSSVQNTNKWNQARRAILALGSS